MGDGDFDSQILMKHVVYEFKGCFWDNIWASFEGYFGSVLK
jgi:hypothetical protein